MSRVPEGKNGPPAPAGCKHQRKSRTMAAAMQEATHTEWTRVLRDLRPHEIMHTVERRKPAVHAAWLARAIDPHQLDVYANRWHDAGWSPSEWWMLAVSVTVFERSPERPLSEGPQALSRNAEADGRRFQREFAYVIHPEQWADWRELAREHGPLSATIALLDQRDIPLNAKLHWASAEEKVTKPGLGRPGEPLR